MAEENQKPNQSLLDEACEILVQSEILKETVFWQSEQVEKFVNKYPDEVLNRMTTEEQLENVRKAEELWARLNQSVKELKKLNDDYESLRLRVKKQYGREIMPPLPPFISPGLDDADVDMGK
jgi:hypothetical protein